MPSPLPERFIPERLIAMGGMGELRRYRDTALGRDVVVKAVRGDQQSNETARQRFVREVRIQASLQHPCIVPVYDVGNVERNDVYFTMAHVGGRTLHQVLEGLRDRDLAIEQRFSRRQLLDAFCRVCLAVAFAHERGVIHRDLKPENIMLGDYGEVYILDWGVAKQDDGRDRKSASGSSRAESGVESLPSLRFEDPGEDDDLQELTAAGSTLGTLEYMPPEQYLASHLPDERGDVYALGAILYEVLTLQWFRDAATRQDLVRLVWRETLRPLDRPPVAGAYAALDEIWRKATALRREDRFQSARALHDAIVSQLDAEREIDRRREVASEHTRAAALELEKVGGSAADAEARRLRALRSLGVALAVDPSQAETLEAVVSRLLDHPVEVTPEDTDPALTAQHFKARRTFRRSLVVCAAWLALLIVDKASSGALGRAPLASPWAIALTGVAMLPLLLAQVRIARVIADLSRSERTAWARARRVKQLLLAKPPLPGETAETTALQEGRAPGKKRCGVLVVDDDPVMLKVISAVLSRSMDVVTCTSGEAALRALRERDFHVVCADYQMPGMHGVELLERVSRASPDTGCVLMTGSREYSRSEHRRGGHVLLKPFEPERVLSLVEHVARISEMKRSVGAAPAAGTSAP